MIGRPSTRITTSCGICKKQISVKPSRMREINYCSQICFHQAHSGTNHPNFGKHHSAETKRKQSEVKIGNTYALGNKSGLGKHLSEERKHKLSEERIGIPRPFMRGANHPNWNGGVTPLHKQIWCSLEYKNWRRQVFERDKYTCVLCGDNKGGNLEADHIKPRYTHPELIFDITNGRTLCHRCHTQTPTYGRRVKTLQAA